MTGAQPSVPPPAPWSFPRPYRERLDNGLTVQVCPMPQQYLVSVVVLLDLPLATEPADGAAVAMTELLAGDDRRRRLDRLGGSWQTGVDLHGPRIVVDVPAWHLPQALQVIAAALTHPRFTAAAVATYAGRALAQLAHERAHPPARAAAEFQTLLCGPQVRAGRRLAGSAAALRALDPGLLALLHAEQVTADRTTVIVAGEVEPAAVHELVRRAFGRWQAVAGPATAEPAPDPPEPPGLVIVDRPGAPQTQIVLGCRSIDRRSADWPLVRVAEQLLSGGASARLNAVLRERGGYTYGVQARFLPWRDGGVFSVAGALGTQVTVAALQELTDVLRRAGRDGFTAAECAGAAAHIVRSAPAVFETAQAVAAQCAELVAAGLGGAFLDGYLSRMTAVSAGEVSAAFARSVDVSALSLVAVGDAALIAPALRRAGMFTAG